MEYSFDGFRSCRASLAWSGLNCTDFFCAVNPCVQVSEGQLDRDSINEYIKSVKLARETSNLSLGMVR